MRNEIREVTIDELDAVVGGRTSLETAAALNAATGDIKTNTEFVYYLTGYVQGLAGIGAH
jgi:hypothetical protein